MADGTSRPNILLILTDQHSPRFAGFAGADFVRTQHLDELAARSVQFDAAVCATPMCTPSRMCMLTGKEAHHCSAWHNHYILYPEHVTWPGHFASHGYRTCLVGKMHFGGRDQYNGFQDRPYGDLHHGMCHQPDPIDLYPGFANAEAAGTVSEIPESLQQDVVVTTESLAWLLEHRSDQPQTPWFLCASYGRPHPPWAAPQRHLSRYRGKVPPAEVPPDCKERLEPFARKLFGHTFVDVTSEQSLRAREAYCACVDFVDDCIGQLFQRMEAAGLLDNTIVVYTSDHGEMAGQFGMFGKAVYYDGSVGVPLLMTGPGIREGHHRAAGPISLMDLFPTTCALASLPVPDGLDGVDFSGMLAQPAETPGPRRYAPSEYFMYTKRVQHHQTIDETQPCSAMRVVRGRRWKYVEIEGGEPLLFDLANDPDELVNLASQPEHAGRCAEMKEALFEGFSWQDVHERFAADRERMPSFFSGRRPGTPNQYVLGDGRVFDAEKGLYDARWLHISDEMTGGIIPQMYG